MNMRSSLFVDRSMWKNPGFPGCRVTSTLIADSFFIFGWLLLGVISFGGSIRGLCAACFTRSLRCIAHGEPLPCAACFTRSPSPCAVCFTRLGRAIFFAVLRPRIVFQEAQNEHWFCRQPFTLGCVLIRGCDKLLMRSSCLNRIPVRRTKHHVSSAPRIGITELL